MINHLDEDIREKIGKYFKNIRDDNKYIKELDKKVDFIYGSNKHEEVILFNQILGFNAKYYDIKLIY